MSRPSIAVLGAGLQGSCVALALAARGHRVMLLERRAAPMLAASLRNEGKIHLGFVYALDASGLTRQRMLEGALSFAPLLDSWCGPLPWDAWRSDGFRYAIMPDSLADAAQLEAAYVDLGARLPDVVASCRLSPHYLGRNLTWLWRWSRDLRGRPMVNGCPVSQTAETEEVAVDPRQLARAVGTTVAAHPLIDLRCNTRVLGAERRQGRFRLEIETPDSAPTSVDVEAVANCTWEDRTRLDRTIGIGVDAPGHCYRVKSQIIVSPESPSHGLVPVTMVQGQYGDIVPWTHGEVYVSWYPESRTYFAEVPPPATSDDVPAALAVAQRSLRALALLFPDLRGARILASNAGIIVARGATDIDDASSALHERTAFGVSMHDGWWSVDPGKLTTAPFVADVAAAHIDREIRCAVA